MNANQRTIIPNTGKKFVMLLALLIGLFVSCDHWPNGQSNGEGNPQNQVRKYPADVAVTWINLQQDLTKATPGFDPLVAARAFAYSGLTLYESVVKGMPGFRSVASSKIGTDIHAGPKTPVVFWPASANAAMAYIMKKLYASTSAANMQKIDSLETAFNELFEQKVPTHVLVRSSEYGTTIAQRIFEWSKTDGGHEAYLASTHPDYVPPTGPGLWIPTPPGFSQPVRPYWGVNRSFVSQIATLTLPAPPPGYSENTDSEFYEAVDEVYTKSLSLSADEISMVKTWGDIPGNYGTSSHYTHIATQLIQQNGRKLDDAALIYAKHGMAIYDATISVFKAKYTYNTIRPVSYIRNVMGHATWSSVIGTPPHPEYPSAHATIGGASYTVLESIFGKNHSFVDRTHEDLWGARSYGSLRDYAVEASYSRFLGGIHYNFSAEVGLEQGEHVGSLINQIQFRGN